VALVAIPRSPGGSLFQMMNSKTVQVPPAVNSRHSSRIVQPGEVRQGRHWLTPAGLGGAVGAGLPHHPAAVANQHPRAGGRNSTPELPEKTTCRPIRPKWKRRSPGHSASGRWRFAASCSGSPGGESPVRPAGAGAWHKAKVPIASGRRECARIRRRPRPVCPIDIPPASQLGTAERIRIRGRDRSR